MTLAPTRTRMPIDDLALTIEEYRRRSPAQIAAILFVEYGDAGPGSNPVVMEYGARMEYA